MIIGEWWKADTEIVINQAMQTGLAPNLSDAYTINGFPGFLYNGTTKGKQQHDNRTGEIKIGRTSMQSLGVFIVIL